MGGLTKARMGDDYKRSGRNLEGNIGIFLRRKTLFVMEKKEE
jgi:hypothetical protein